MKRITTSKQEIELVLENKLSRNQIRDMETIFHNAGTTFYGNDVRSYLVRELNTMFDKVGVGGNHVWFSDNNNNRIGLIKIK